MKLTPAALVLLAGAAAGCAGPEVRGPFRNQYIDADTGKPIEGVVFLAVWERVLPTLTGDGGRSFYDAREAVSGPDGRVEIPQLRSLIPAAALDVEFHAFAPEYDYADSKSVVIPADGQAYVDPTVTRLRRLTSLEERCKVVHRPLIPALPGEAMARYVAAVDAERGSLNCGQSRESSR